MKKRQVSESWKNRKYWKGVIEPMNSKMELGVLIGLWECQQDVDILIPSFAQG